MKRQFLSLLSVFLIVGSAATAYADHHLELSDELASLQCLVGEWEMEFEGNGSTHKIRTSTKPDAQGHVLRTSGSWHRDGEAVATWFTLYYKDASKGIVSVNVISNGSRNHGTTTMSDDTLITKSEGTNQDGDKITYESHVKKVDDDTISSQRVNIVINGEARDDWPVGTYTRVK